MTLVDKLTHVRDRLKRQDDVVAVLVLTEAIEALAARPALPATGTAPDVELTDSMIMQMLGEASAAARRAGEDALTIDCTPQQVYDIELGARCETIRSYLYQAGILNAERAATGTGAWQRIDELEHRMRELRPTTDISYERAIEDVFDLIGQMREPPAPSTERG